MDLILIEFLHDSIFLFPAHLSMDESDRELREDDREGDLHLDSGGDIFICFFFSENHFRTFVTESTKGLGGDNSIFW